MWSFRCRAEVRCRSGPIELKVPSGGTQRAAIGRGTWTAVSLQRQGSRVQAGQGNLHGGGGSILAGRRGAASWQEKSRGTPGIDTSMVGTYL